MQTQPRPKSDSKYSFDNEIALRQFFETAPMMMGIAEVVDNDIRHVFDNPAAAEFFGCSAEEMQGKFASELGIPPETIELWVENYKKSYEKSSPVHFEYTHPPDSKSNHFSVTVSFMEEKENGTRHYSYIVQDISAQKAAEKNLKYSNKQLEQGLDERTRALKLQKNKLDCLLNAAPIGIAFLDQDLRYEIINPVLAKINGYEPEYHIGKTIHDILPQEATEYEKFLRNIVESGEQVLNWEYKAHIKSDSNKVHTFLGNYFPVHHEGKPLGIGATITDITEQKKIEEALRSDEAHVRQIANAMPQIVWTATPDGFVDWYNERWYEFTGVERGSNWNDEQNPMHPDDFGRVLEKWQKSVETGEPYETECRFLRAVDGQYRWHLARAVPVHDYQSNIIKWIGSNTDIHDQKELLNKVEEERDLREYFIAAVSHDLRTPLTAAKMGAQLLLRKTGDPLAISRTSLRISDNMDRADSMIRDLLDASRIRAGEKIPVELSTCHLNQLATDTLAELSTIHGDRFVLHAREEITGEWSCKGIRRIIENLCGNAIKYGNPDTAITLCLDNKEGFAEIQVHNQGSPISEEDQKRLFDAFRRTGSDKTSSQKGWGLGLTLVKGLAESHGGSVSVNSSSRHGTTFKVLLPLQAPE